jgi:hypothetical protein
MYNYTMTTHIIHALSDSTATRLTPNGVHSGMDITIQNTDSTAIVFIGGEGVTSSSFGYLLNPGQAWSAELPGKDALYAISDTNESVVAVLQLGLESQD